MNSSMGPLRLFPDGPVEAGAFDSWTFEFRPEGGLAVGDTFEIVFFTRFSTNLWSLPQVHDPTAPGFTTAARSDGGFVHLEVWRLPAIWRPHGVTLHVIRATTGASDLGANETLTIVYGDQSGGSPGAQAQFLARQVVFPVFVATKRGESARGRPTISLAEAIESIPRPTLAEISAAATFTPALEVVGGRASTFHAVIPSLAQVHAGMPVRVTAMDIHGNRAAGHTGRASLFVLEESKPAVARLGEVDLRQGRGTGTVHVSSPGIARVIALDPENRITGTAAPSRLSTAEPETRLFWGEIHAHSILSDALGRAEEHFEYAACDAGLDFGAITDHDTWMARSPGAWEKVIGATERFNRPGSFVTLLGYEIFVTAGGRYSSHANLYFPGPSGPLVARPDIRDVRALCQEEGAIVVPHHTQYGWPNMGVNWDDWSDFTPDEMPAVEIFSTHGSSEYLGCPRSVLWPVAGRSVQDGLARGHRFGLIAGSDYHECLLGHRMDIERYPRTINNRHMQTHSGLVAVYAKELSREAIFEAIRSRRVYATSGDRILLWFEINGTPMGGEAAIQGPTTPRTLTVRAAGSRSIERIDIIRDGGVVHAEGGGGPDADFAWRDADPVRDGAYYYVRVNQADGEQAWSSPVWIALTGEGNRPRSARARRPERPRPGRS